MQAKSISDIVLMSNAAYVITIHAHIYFSTFLLIPLLMPASTMAALKGLSALLAYHVIGTFFYARASPD